MFLCCSPTHSLSTQAHPDPKRNDTYVPALKDRALYYKLQNQHKVLLKKQVVGPTAYYCRMTIIESFDPNYSQRKKGPSSAQQKKMHVRIYTSQLSQSQTASVSYKCRVRPSTHRTQKAELQRCHFTFFLCFSVKSVSVFSFLALCMIIIMCDRI